MEIVLIKSFTDKPWRSPETYDLIEKALTEKWVVHSIITEDSDVLHQYLIDKASRSKSGMFVFNVAEFLDETTKNGFVPGLLDEWNFPHLGSCAKVITTGLDKAKTKKILIENGVLTPNFFIADGIEIDYSDQIEKVGFPMFVKPIHEGGHIGIGEESIVNDRVELDNAISNIQNNYTQSALVEEFIAGYETREFSVGIIDGESKIFTPVEIDFASMHLRTDILSFEAAEMDLERIMLVQEKQIRDELIQLTEKTFTAMGATDYSRVDIRMNQKGFFVLEINVMPGLGPHSFLPEAAETIHGINYHRLIQILVENSINRLGITQINKRYSGSLDSN